MHFYERQMIDDFVQLGENSLQLCQKNGRFRDDHFGSFIRTHVQNALDFFHTAEVLITAELQSLASPSGHVCRRCGSDKWLPSRSCYDSFSSIA